MLPRTQPTKTINILNIDVPFEKSDIVEFLEETEHKGLFWFTIDDYQERLQIHTKRPLPKDQVWNSLGYHTLLNVSCVEWESFGEWESAIVEITYEDLLELIK